MVLLACGELIKNLIGLLEHLVVRVKFGFVETRVDQFVATHPGTLVLEPFLQHLLLQLFFFIRGEFKYFAGEYPLLGSLFKVLLHLFPLFKAEIEHSESITNDILFYFVVQRRVSAEGGTGVYFEQ